MSRLLVSLSLLTLVAPAAAAQDESALNRALLGQQVRIRVDMPASHKGIDLRFDRATPLDDRENRDRIREHDVFFATGDALPVTQIKVKGDMIEFHLGGGGLNWFFEAASTRTATISEKTVREIDLEREIRDESDRDRRRRLERELDSLRRDRERRDAREQREVEEYNRTVFDQNRDRAMRSGSRFNLRFKKFVPADALTPEGLERYLEPWAEFPRRAVDAPAPLPSGPSRDWKKGTPRREIEDVLGRASRERGCPGEDTGLDCRIATFNDGNDEIEVTFVEGVLVRFVTRPR